MKPSGWTGDDWEWVRSDGLLVRETPTGTVIQGRFDDWMERGLCQRVVFDHVRGDLEAAAAQADQDYPVK